MKIGCVLLAAGEGSRLGCMPKALIRIDGKTIIEHQIEALNAIGVEKIIVVTGYYYDRIEAVLKDLPVQITRNKLLEGNQASSVRLGIESLGSKFDLVFMLLSDQPLINKDDLLELIHAHQQHDHLPIVLPVVNGARGNPVLFTGDAMSEVIANKKMVCRSYMDANPEKVFLYETLNQHFVTDIDETKDLETIKKIWNVECELP